MAKFWKIIFCIISLFLIYYAYLPNPGFPTPPPDSVQSAEPADIENINRRAYFTNLTREEVISHYKKEFNKGFPVYTPRLNYPPEESATIIRDQTMSTFLEEIVHPLRESIYINGFEPKSEKDTIIIDGRHWRQKIIVKYSPSQLCDRLLILVLTISVSIVLLNEFKYVKNK